MATVRTVAAGARSLAWAAWAAEWVITVPARFEQGPDQGDVAGAAFVRQDVVADDGGFRAAQGAHDGEVGGHLEGGEQDEDDQVGGSQPTARGEPAVRAVPGQPAVGARVRLALGDVDGLLAGVEAPGVLGAPGLDDHVVAGRGQPVRQLGGVPGAAALVRVGRADEGDPHVLRALLHHWARERTIRSASSASEARIIPVTKIRMVSLAKCSGCTTRS